MMHIAKHSAFQFDFVQVQKWLLKSLNSSLYTSDKLSQKQKYKKAACIMN